MLMLYLNEAIDLLAMASSVNWYGCVLNSSDVHGFGKQVDFDVEGQSK